MAGVLGEHHLECGRCRVKIFASAAKLHYLGFWTCSDCYQEYPIALRPIPEAKEGPGPPAWKIRVNSPITFIDPHDTWSTIDETWSTIDLTWDEL